MENKELDKLVTRFIDKCEQKNYDGIMAVTSDNDSRINIGAYTNPFTAVDLLAHILRKLQNTFEVPATFFAVQAAVMAVLIDMDNDTANETHAQTWKKSIDLVQDFMNKELEQMRLEEVKG